MAGTAGVWCLHAWFHQAPTEGPESRLDLPSLWFCFPIRTGARRAAATVDQWGEIWPSLTGCTPVLCVVWP